MSTLEIDLANTPAMEPPDGGLPDFDAGWTSVQVGTVIAFGVSFFPATLALALRYFQLVKLERKFEIDLAIITLSFGLAIGYFVVTVILMNYGWGQHLWNVSLADMVEFQKLLLPNLLMYLLSTACTKTALLTVLFFINPSRPYRICVCIVGFVIFAYTLSFCVITGGPCKPTDSSNMPCLEAMVKAQAVLNIATDLAIIATPIPTIWNLHLSVRQKLTIGGLLAIGSGVIVCSIVRLPYVLEISNQKDISWFEAILGIWSIVEANLAITLASAMRLKPLIARYFPSLGFFSSSHEGSNTANSKRKQWTPNDRSKGQHSYQLHSVQKSSSDPYSDPPAGISVLHSYSVDVANSAKDRSSSEEILKKGRQV